MVEKVIHTTYQIVCWNVSGAIGPEHSTQVRKIHLNRKKKAFALTWACERSADYLTEIKFHIQTNHKLLFPLFSTKNLEELAT